MQQVTPPTSTTANQNQTIDRLISMSEVETITSLRKSKIYALMRTSEFVKPVRLSARCTRWSYAAVQAWVQARIEEAGTQQ